MSKIKKQEGDAQTPEVVETETPKETVTTKEENALMNKLLARIEQLEAKQKEEDFDDPVSIARRKKERYKGPWHYAFTLRGGVPVLSRTSKRMDETKDLVFLNKYGTYESNHALVLNLADGKTIEIEVNLFNRDKQKTLPLPAKVVTDETGNTTYEFNTPDYGKVVILSSKFLN